MAQTTARRPAVQAPSLWAGLSTVFHGLSRAIAAVGAPSEGLAALEREHARIRLESRHWLM